MIDVRMRRVRWMAGIVVLVLGLLILAWFNGRRCLVLVYNESPFVRAGVVAQGSGERWLIEPLPGEGSRQRTIDPDAAAGAWSVQLRPGDVAVAETWFEPGSGRRLIIRVAVDDSVELQVLDAWWE